MTGPLPLPDRLTRLARVTSELVDARTVEEVSRAVVMHGAEAVGAALASMTLVCDDRRTARLVALSGGLAGDEERWSTFPVSADLPAAEVIRTGRRLVVTGRDAILARFSDVPARGLETLVTLPLGSGDDVIGSITLSFTEPRRLEDAEIEFLDILGNACAQSIGRIAAQHEAARQRAKLEFLAQAATELASSLDYQATLARVARLAVPTFADWCAIDLVDDGRLRRLSVAHVDPAKVQLAHDLAERYPADREAAHGAWQVMRTGRSELIAEITDDMLTAGAVDAEHAEIARALHLRSAVTVPLVARGRILGVMTWVAAESERHYTPDDLALAEELAQRAAVSLDNADLHSQTLAAAVQLQRAVLPDALPAAHGWELAHHYSPAGRTEVGGDFYDVIERDDGGLVLFIGDVMGRGVEAAAAMAQVRAAVRAYAALDPRPRAVLGHLDEMFDHYGSEQLVTLLYLLVDPARDEAVIGNAGHPPPVLVRGDGTLVELPSADGPPLGVGIQERSETVVAFTVEDTLIAFTDGLVERRGEDITEGQARVACAAQAHRGKPLADAVASLVQQVGDPSRDDDIAVLGARRLA
ncbi:GAF domain-containing SpoIIE family protein phosphatase [Nocardioides sp. Soil774]|uniref:GAF domain-containing SpoIIE family protein phosphatase n=1 Tax=Nocardioides sp. Soil774 TaxID=1736408 RepID=UPI00138ED41E|nr:SpoIIE family protein phosphatase [Nocardioides sp. Soil774]